MKVISGFLKGRNIKGYNILGTRPTMDRVKESIFAIIQNKVKDAIVLDLFAGSGSYGIEAISNYAKEVVFNDKNKECINLITKTLTDFKVLDKARFYNLDYLKCLNVLKDNKVKFDLIFLDPPYKLDVLNDILDYLSVNGLVREGGLVIVEFENFELKDRYNNLELKKEKKYGLKRVFIYENMEKNE